MKKLIIASAAVLALASYPAFALEPWHDYFTLKAMKEKAAKRHAAEGAAPSGEPRSPKRQLDGSARKEPRTPPAR